jgi:hypothetical protein
LWQGVWKGVQGGRGGEEFARRCGALFIAHGTSSRSGQSSALMICSETACARSHSDAVPRVSQRSSASSTGRFTLCEPSNNSNPISQARFARSKRLFFSRTDVLACEAFTVLVLTFRSKALLFSLFNIIASFRKYVALLQLAFSFWGCRCLCQVVLVNCDVERTCNRIVSGHVASARKKKAKLKRKLLLIGFWVIRCRFLPRYRCNNHRYAS